MKRALVTGAATLIAKQSIVKLLEAGWWVVAVSQRPPIINNAEQYHTHEIDEHGVSVSIPRYHWHAMDLSDDRFRYALANAVRHQPIDLLVHCSLPTLRDSVLSALGEYAADARVLSGFEFLHRGSDDE